MLRRRSILFLRRRLGLVTDRRGCGRGTGTSRVRCPSRSINESGVSDTFERRQRLLQISIARIKIRRIG